MRTTFFAALGVFAISGSALALPIYSDAYGREWLNANDIRYKSWNELAAVCDPLSGLCSGSITTFVGNAFVPADLTGYTWASRDDVRELFYEIAGFPAGTLDSDSALVANHYGMTALSIFPPTFGGFTYPNFAYLDGFTRSTLTQADGSSAPVRGFVTFASCQRPDIDCTNSFFDALFSVEETVTSFDFKTVEFGTYLYRPVPEPSTLALLGVGLAAIALMRRRRVA